ncbi:aminotransferase class I/II-fold pyridoxal phosphate-dependent enzyme, partial [Vibrio parahaemolyticus]
MGAFVLGCAEARELLINRARTFIFSTALSPIVVRQLELAARIVLERKARREKCLENARWLRARL